MAAVQDAKRKTKRKTNRCEIKTKTHVCVLGALLRGVESLDSCGCALALWVEEAAHLSERGCALARPLPVSTLVLTPAQVCLGRPAAAGIRLQAARRERFRWPWPRQRGRGRPGLQESEGHQANQQLYAITRTWGHCLITSTCTLHTGVLADTLYWDPT